MEEMNPILNAVRQRYPFLLIDRILKIEKGKKVVGLKNVTFNEPYFQGHFPDEPVVPAVLLVESMAQLSSLLAEKGSAAYLTAIYKARFLQKVVPGDQMIIESEIVKQVKNLVQVACSVHVEQKKVARAELGFMVFLEEEANE